MKKHQNKQSEELRNKTKISALKDSMFVLFFTIAGSILLAITLAATSVYIFEAESGSRSGGVSQGSDGQASNGSFVEFLENPQTCDGISLCTIVDNSTDWNRWINAGPGGGGYFMHSSIGSDGSLLVGSDLGGAFYSNDSGSYWRQIGKAQGMTQTHSPTVAHHPNNPDIIFSATSSTGLYRSTDAGQTMTQVIATGRICALGIGETISYASRADNWDEDCKEILVSVDDGENWSTVYTLPDNTHVMNIRISKADNDHVLFVSQAGRFFNVGDGALRTVWQSNDQGASMTLLPLGYNSFDANWSEDGQTVYLTTDETDTPNQSAGRLRSKGLGLADPISDLNTDVTGMIWVPAGTSDTLRLVDRNAWGPWISGEGMFESTDGGANFTQISSIGDPPPGTSDHTWGWTTARWSYTFRNVKDFVFSRTDPNLAMYTTNQFVRATSDGGRTFQDKTSVAQDSYWSSTGIDNTTANFIMEHPQDSNFVLAGYIDVGCMRSLDSGVSWQNCNQVGYTAGWGPDGGNVYAGAMDPTDEDKVWISNGDRGDQDLLVSTNKGAVGSWSPRMTGLPGSVAINEIEIDESSPEGNRTMFVSAGGDIYKSTDEGDNWSLVLSCGDCFRLAIDQQSDRVMTGGSSTVWVSETGGDFGTWTSSSLPGYSQLSTGLITASAYRGISDVSDDPNNSNVFWVTAMGPSGGTFEYNAGTITRRRSQYHSRTVAVNPSSGEVISGSSAAYGSGCGACDSDGLAISSDNGLNWTVLDTPLSYPLVSDAVFNKSGSRIWLNNPGLGLFRID